MLRTQPRVSGGSARTSSRHSAPGPAHGGGGRWGRGSGPEGGGGWDTRGGDVSHRRAGPRRGGEGVQAALKAVEVRVAQAVDQASGAGVAVGRNEAARRRR